MNTKVGKQQQAEDVNIECYKWTSYSPHISL